MLAASHALAGAAIAAVSPTPITGFIIALLSHPLLDFFPHWDFNTRYHHRTKLQIILISLTDAGIGLGLGWLLFSPPVPAVVLLITMLLAQGPDWLEAPYHILNYNFPPFSTIKRLQSRWHTKLGLPWGLILQVVFIVVILLLVI